MPGLWENRNFYYSKPLLGAIPLPHHRAYRSVHGGSNSRSVGSDRVMFGLLPGYSRSTATISRSRTEGTVEAQPAAVLLHGHLAPRHAGAAPAGPAPPPAAGR